MSDNPRRWPAFSLRTLFVLLTGLGVWLGWQVRAVQERKAILNKLEGRKSVYINRWPTLFSGEVLDRESVHIPIWRKWLGDRPIQFISLPDAGLETEGTALTAEEFDRVKAAFPEADVWCYERWIPGP